MKHLEEKYRKNWQIVLTKNKFTEYSLYWLFLVHVMKEDPFKYYILESDEELSGNNCWFETGTNINQILEKSFVENGNYYFSLFQSHIDLDVHLLEKSIRRFIS